MSKIRRGDILLPHLLRRLEIIKKSSKESLASKDLEDIIKNFFYKGNKNGLDSKKT